MRKISWNEFYAGFTSWALPVQISCADDLEEFGDTEEVLEIVLKFALHDKEYASRFLERALDAGVTFTPEQVLELVGEVTTQALSKMAVKTSMAFDFDIEELSAVFGVLEQDAFDRISSRTLEV